MDKKYSEKVNQLHSEVVKKEAATLPSKLKSLQVKDLKDKIVVDGVTFDYGGGSASSLGGYMFRGNLAEMHYSAYNEDRNKAVSQFGFSSFSVFIKFSGDKLSISKIDVKM